MKLPRSNGADLPSTHTFQFGSYLSFSNRMEGWSAFASSTMRLGAYDLNSTVPAGAVAAAGAGAGKELATSTVRMGSKSLLPRSLSVAWSLVLSRQFEWRLARGNAPVNSKTAK